MGALNRRAGGSLDWDLAEPVGAARRSVPALLTGSFAVDFSRTPEGSRYYLAFRGVVGLQKEVEKRGAALEEVQVALRRAEIFVSSCAACAVDLDCST